MNKLSVTITGLLTIIISEFVPVEELEVVLTAIGIVVAWYGRYRLGGISLLGVKPRD